MWIFLGIVAFLAVLITAILFLPVSIILKNDADNNLILLYKLLFKTFGEEPNPNSTLVRVLKESSGVARIEKNSLEKNVEASGLLPTVSDTLRILLDLLKEIFVLLHDCTVKKCQVHIVCAEDTAADSALSYGQCCATVYPLIGLLHSLVKVGKRAEDIDIRCDFSGGAPVFRYHFVISVRLCHVLAAFFRIALAEARRAANEVPPPAPRHQER